VIVAAAATAPAAASATGIVVRLSGAERHLSPEEIAAAVDRPAGSYLLRARGTAAEPVAHPPALSLRRLVALAGGSPDALSFVAIERPNGTLAILRRADLADPSPFSDGPPIVWMDAGGTRYLRPLRRPSDVNAADNLDITGSDLAVRVHQGPLLGVRARTDRRTVPAGEAVNLTAEVTGAPPGQTLSFDWTFGDGTGKPGQAARHRFRTPGVYEAVVTVNGADDSGGSSAPLRIRVGEPPNAAGDTGGGTGERQRSPAQGPARGGSTDGDGEPSQRAPSTTATPTSSTPAPAAPATPLPQRTSQPPRPLPTASSPLRRAARPRPQSRTLAGPVIRGTLVAARTTTPLAGDTSAPSRGGEPAAARRGTDPRSDPFAPVAGILAAMALMGLGGRRERRDLRPRPEVAT
jgi:PKD domain